jgi:hypothetical protein
MSPWHIALDTSTLDPALAGNLVGGIKKVAPQSTLISVPAIAASYAALVAKAVTLAQCVTAVAEDEKLLKADTQSRDTAYSALLLELVGLKGLVLSNAKSDTDITGMGFVLLNSTKASRTKPDPPGALLVKIGKAHGKARVSVPGKTRGRFVAEAASDPNGPYSPLPGNGKERKLSGYAPGTKLWVHMAQVRYGLQSDWSTPVLITFS